MGGGVERLAIGVLAAALAVPARSMLERTPPNKRMKPTAPLGAAPHRMEAVPRARPSASTGAAAYPQWSADLMSHS